MRWWKRTRPQFFTRRLRMLFQSRCRLLYDPQFFAMYNLFFTFRTLCAFIFALDSYCSTLHESHNHESPSVAVTVTNCLTLATQLLQYYFTYFHDVVSERMSSGKAHTSSLFNSAMSSFVRSSIFHFPVLHFSVPGVGRSFFGLAFSQSIIIRLLFENRWRSERRRRPNSTSAKTYYVIIIIIISPPEQLMISHTNSVSEQP